MALARGISHRELLETTSAAEISEYRALHMIDPLWDGERLEAAIGSLTNVTFNLNRHPDTDATEVKDWIPDYAAVLTAKSVDNMSDDFDRWYAAEKAKGNV